MNIKYCKFCYELLLGKALLFPLLPLFVESFNYRGFTKHFFNLSLAQLYDGDFILQPFHIVLVEVSHGCRRRSRCCSTTEKQCLHAAVARGLFRSARETFQGCRGSQRDDAAGVHLRALTAVTTQKTTMLLRSQRVQHWHDHQWYAVA